VTEVWHHSGTEVAGECEQGCSSVTEEIALLHQRKNPI